LLTKVGLTLTAFWVIAIAGIIYLKWESALTMELNAWGDFLAGLSTPLALLWLVIGYFQQGEELRLNTKALVAQQEELKRQVTETALLAKNSERQATASEMLAMINKDEAERKELQKRVDAQPIFFALGGSTGGVKIETNVQNKGGDIFDVSVHFNGPHQLSLSHSRHWERGQNGQITITQAYGKALEWPINFSINYRDSLDEIHTRCFQFTKAHELSEIHS